MTILAQGVTFGNHLYQLVKIRFVPMTNMHQKIAGIRRLLRHSQEEAASLCNFSLRTYQRIESGACSLRLGHLENLAVGFQCSVEDILYFNPEENSFQLKKDREHVLEQEYAQLQAEVARLRHQVKMLESIGGGQRRINFEVSTRS